MSRKGTERIVCNRGWTHNTHHVARWLMNKQRQNIRGELCNSDPCPSKARGNRTCRALALEDVGSWGWTQHRSLASQITDIGSQKTWISLGLDQVGMHSASCRLATTPSSMLVGAKALGESRTVGVGDSEAYLLTLFPRSFCRAWACLLRVASLLLFKFLAMHKHQNHNEEQRLQARLVLLGSNPCCVLSRALAWSCVWANLLRRDSQGLMNKDDWRDETNTCGRPWINWSKLECGLWVVLNILFQLRKDDGCTFSQLPFHLFCGWLNALRIRWCSQCWALARRGWATWVVAAGYDVHCCSGRMRGSAKI
jgi:hypothetical protein